MRARILNQGRQTFDVVVPINCVEDVVVVVAREHAHGYFCLSKCNKAVTTVSQMVVFTYIYVQNLSLVVLVSNANDNTHILNIRFNCHSTILFTQIICSLFLKISEHTSFLHLENCFSLLLCHCFLFVSPPPPFQLFLSISYWSKNSFQCFGFAHD